jgi:uncharacterized tellurite resistance protein B-like protein
MLRGWRRLFAGGQPPAPDRLAVSVAALLVEAARADERYTDEERRLVERLLAERFPDRSAEAAAILREAERLQSDAVDLHRFTKHAKALPERERTALIEALWRIVLSDGERGAYEDALVRRVAGLLHVSDVESGHARRCAQADLGN